jgi:DNA (cytosine-5)-methyltransferase 1
MTFGSLFAGIGGFDLGLERAGLTCRWQVEIDPYCQRVLAKHWPNVRRWDDVRTWPQPDTERVDVICGGFPCQDISTANPRRKGIAGQRSGLWQEFRRIVCEMEPRIVVVENVSNLTVLGLDQVLGGFAELGFDAEWATIPASSFGAPQSRRRMFIIAYPMRERWPVVLRSEPSPFGKEAPWGEWQSHSPDSPGGVLQAVEKSVGESSVLRSSDGILAAVDRLRTIGNAVLPQATEYIGRRILESAAIDAARKGVRG